MPKYESYTLLKDLTKHTNMNLVTGKYIGVDKYPEQNTDLLNTVVQITYKDKRIVDDFPHGPNSDDIAMFRPGNDRAGLDLDSKEGFIKDDIINHFTDNFLIIRCDAVEPYRLVAVSDDFRVVLVGSSKLDEHGTLTLDCREYGPQYDGAIGAYCKPVYEYVYDENGRMIKIDTDYSPDAYIFMSEIGEDCNSVIIEYNTDTTYRVILEDEIDIDVLENIFDNEYEISSFEIAEIRKSMLGDRLPYGVN